jgi:hypothetical protein
MALEVYVRNDIQRGITSVTVGIVAASMAHGGGNVEYLRGVHDAARSLALQFGVPWPEVVAELPAGAGVLEAGDG